jgi:hypothetical protein
MSREGHPHRSRAVPIPVLLAESALDIRNVAMGGHFVGPPVEETRFPRTMLVDRVRVHRRLP